MRSARALAEQLVREEHHGKIDPLTYGLLTGLVVTYARPFTESRDLGRLESKWSSFPDRPDFKRHHDRLIEYRRTLLAHTDNPSRRRVAIFTRGYFSDRPVVTEGRSGIDTRGIANVIELVKFQEERFRRATDEIAARLHNLASWPERELIELDVSGQFEIIDSSSETFVDTSLPDKP
jgi:hypothetical protein